MIELVFVLTLIFGLLWLYHLGSEHGKEITAINLNLAAAKEATIRLTAALEKKNAYIRTIEKTLLDRASASDVAGILNRMFSDKDEGSLRASELHPGRPTGAAVAGVRDPGRKPRRAEHRERQGTDSLLDGRRQMDRRNDDPLQRKLK